MNFKIEGKYFNEILLGNKKWEIRTEESYDEKKRQTGERTLYLEVDEMQYIAQKTKKIAVMPFYRIPEEILENAFCIGKFGFKPKSIKAKCFEEMQRFYKDFTIDTVCVLMEMK